MATRAEQFRSDAQRKGRSKKASAKQTPASRASTARSSGRSRVKRDAALNVTEEMRKGSPEQRARKGRAQATRVRGSRR